MMPVLEQTDIWSELENSETDLTLRMHMVDTVCCGNSISEKWSI